MTIEERMAEQFLNGYRVLDMTDEKGHYCTKLLADLGADVLKVEPPTGNKTRIRGPFLGDQTYHEKSLYFLYYNTNKRSITLNLDHHDGRVIFKQLAETTDAIVETYPVGYLKKLGLDYQSLKEINPKLVMASITPFGQTGPWKDYESSDLIIMGMSGYMQVTGNPDEPPVRLGNEQSHFPPSQYAALGIVGALYYRDVISGRGQYIDVSMQESLIPFYVNNLPAQAWLDQGVNVIRVGGASLTVVPGGLFLCKDGWSGIATMTPVEWESLAQWIYETTDNEAVLDPKFKGGLQARRDYVDEVTALVMDFSVRHTKSELFHEGQKRNLVMIPVNTVEELLNDPHLAAGDYWVELDHAMVGKLKYPGLPFDGDDIPKAMLGAPLLGQHNSDIYCKELGYSPEELVTLRSGGII